MNPNVPSAFRFRCTEVSSKRRPNTSRASPGTACCRNSSSLLRHEVLVEVHVRVSEKRRQVVGRRPHARVLEVDPVEASLVAHEVAAVEVAMAEHARPRRDLLGQPMESLGEGRAVLHRQVAPAKALEEVLLEVVQLPRELLDVEGDLEARRAMGALLRLALEDAQVVERLAVEIVAVPRRGLGERLLQRHVAQVVLDHDPARRRRGRRCWARAGRSPRSSARTPRNGSSSAENGSG